MNQERKENITDMARDLFVAQAEEIISSDAPEATKGARMQAAVTGSINIARHFWKEADRLLDEDSKDEADQEETPIGVAQAKKRAR